MNSFPPHSENHFGSFIPIESDVWCDNKYAQSSNPNNQQHSLNQTIIFDQIQQLDGEDLQTTLHTEELKSSPIAYQSTSSIEYQSRIYEDAAMEPCPFNDFEFHQEAHSLRVIENMTESLTNQLIFPNTTANEDPACLGANFKPSNYNVICGRGKGAYNHVGNRRLKLFIAMHLRDYVNTNSLTKKSEIVDVVINQIREATGSSNGTGFLKVDSAGYWHDVGLEEARKRTARAFRDYSTTGSLASKRNRSTSWDDQRKKRIMEMQNSILKSCQIQFSGDDGVKCES